MDSRFGNARGHEDEGMCEPASVPYRRSDPWPFKYSVTERGIVLNKIPARKKEPKQELGEALL
jgi:hypothetical protein